MRATICFICSGVFFVLGPLPLLILLAMDGLAPGPEVGFKLAFYVALTATAAVMGIAELRGAYRGQLGDGC